MTALREIKLLRELTSPHLVRLFDVFSHKANLCLVSLSWALPYSHARVFLNAASLTVKLVTEAAQVVGSLCP